MRPTFFLAIPYMLVPCWAAMRVFSQSQAPTFCPPHVVSALPECPPSELFPVKTLSF